MSSKSQRMLCPLGDEKHILRGPGVYITNPRHISFVKKNFPNFRPREKVCEECKMLVEKIYKIKYKRALELRRSRSATPSLPSISDVSKETLNSSTTEDSDKPTTSREAAARQKRREEAMQSKKNDDDDIPGINVLRGRRLPHIQPAPRRQQAVYLNPDIMDILLQDIHGG
ncbi:uncharacterized protein [Musca autumnalis]|uniref:uncharacterized protein n=1 Tax=Musca autumnalis TaxID=221902 RepID=UPI003CE761ED